MDLGPHAAFIWISYATTVLVISALLAWLIADGKRQRSALDDLESRGVRRRSSSSTSET
jgi:heme exporter protein D